MTTVLLGLPPRPMTLSSVMLLCNPGTEYQIAAANAKKKYASYVLRYPDYAYTIRTMSEDMNWPRIYIPFLQYSPIPKPSSFDLYSRRELRSLDRYLDVNNFSSKIARVSLQEYGARQPWLTPDVARKIRSFLVSSLDDTRMQVYYKVPILECFTRNYDALSHCSSSPKHCPCFEHNENIQSYTALSAAFTGFARPLLKSRSFILWKVDIDVLPRAWLDVKRLHALVAVTRYYKQAANLHFRIEVAHPYAWRKTYKNYDLVCMYDDDFNDTFLYDDIAMGNHQYAYRNGSYESSAWNNLPWTAMSMMQAFPSWIEIDPEEYTLLTTQHSIVVQIEAHLQKVIDQKNSIAYKLQSIVDRHRLDADCRLAKRVEETEKEASRQDQERINKENKKSGKRKIRWLNETEDVSTTKRSLGLTPPKKVTNVGKEQSIGVTTMTRCIVPSCNILRVDGQRYCVNHVWDYNCSKIDDDVFARFGYPIDDDEKKQ